MAFRVAVHIDRPAEEVWAELTDWSAASRWMVSGELRPLGDAQVGEGSRLAFESRGKTHESEVVAWEPPKRLALQSTQSGMTALYEYRCEPGASGGSDVTLDARCWGNGLVWKLLAPLIGYAMQRADSGQLTKLKTLIEAPSA